MHDKALDLFVERGQMKRLKSGRTLLFGRNHSGFLTPFYIYIKLDLNNGSSDGRNFFLKTDFEENGQ